MTEKIKQTLPEQKKKYSRLAARLAALSLVGASGCAMADNGRYSVIQPSAYATGYVRPQQVVYQQPTYVQAPRTATGGFDALCNTIVNLAGSVTKAADASFYALDAVGDAYDAANRISLSTTARKTTRRKMNAEAERYELNNLSKKVSIARQIGAEVRSMENHRANLRKKQQSRPQQRPAQNYQPVKIFGGKVSGKGDR